MLVNSSSPSARAWSTEVLEKSCGKAKRLSHNALWFWSWSNITTTWAAIGTTTLASLFIRSFSSYKAEAQIKNDTNVNVNVNHGICGIDLDWCIHRNICICILFSYGLGIIVVSVCTSEWVLLFLQYLLGGVKRLSLHTHTHTHTH